MNLLNHRNFKNKTLIDLLLNTFGEDAQLHMVGGCVRDFILGQEPKDFDFCTILTPDQMTQRAFFASTGFKLIPMEKALRRGTVVFLVGSEIVEVTTFRTKGNERQFSQDIKEDLSARDFTINAMAINCHTGELVDPFGGELDLNAKLLRAVGDPEERFQEDPFRIIRGIRFKEQFDMMIEPETLHGMTAKAGWTQPRHGFISQERFTAELCKILVGPNPGNALRNLANLGILYHFIPELLECEGFEQNKWHNHDVLTHIFQVVDATPARLETRLAALFHDIAKPHCLTLAEDDGRRQFLGHETIGSDMAFEIMGRMRFPIETTQKVAKLVLEHMRPIDCGPKAIRRLIRDMGEQLQDWMDLKLADLRSHATFRADEWTEFLENLENEQNRKEIRPFENLAIRGRDLLECGIPQGERIGQILRTAEEMVLENPEINQRQILLDLVTRNLL